MPKKQKTNIRWDLSRGGTGLLFPRGIEPEPWPEWLSKTFVNVHLVQEDPNALREELFDGRNAWGPVETLLYAIEQEAKKVLQENENEENAAAALKSIAAIRSKFFFLRQNGYWYPNEDADPTTAKMLLEMTLLIVASIRGELWGSIWPSTKRGASIMQGLKANSPKAVGAKKTKRE